MDRLIIKAGIKQITAVLVLFVLAILAIRYWNLIMTIVTQREEFESWIKGFGNWGFAVFVIIQFFQVVIFMIPAEVVYFAGGYLYGTLMSSVLSVLGIALGSFACFMLARTLGQPFIEKIMSRSQMEKLKELINTPRASITLFVIYLIPGLPGKDALAYVAGLTPIKFINFFVISMIARSPWIVISCFWGANLEKGNSTVFITITVIAALVFIVGIIKGDSIIRFISSKRASNQ